jgi:hypothetical protein
LGLSLRRLRRLRDIGYVGYYDVGYYDGRLSYSKSLNVRNLLGSQAATLR